MLTLSCPAKCFPEATLAAPEIGNEPEIDIFSSLQDLPAPLWQDLAGEASPFLGLEYLQGLERVFRGEMEFRYVLFRQNNRLLGIAYFQVFGFDTQKLAFYTSGKDLSLGSRLRHGLGKAVEKIAVKDRHKMLVCGNALISGELGWYHPPEVPRSQMLIWLLQAAKKIEAGEKHIFATLIKDLPAFPDERILMQQQGFHRFQAEPDMRLALSEEWESYADYLDALSSKYRQRARSAYKKSKQLLVRELEYEEVIAREEELLGLYREVLRDDKFCLKEIGPGYFPSLYRKLGPDCSATGYFLEGSLVAFRTTLASGPDTLLAHFIGYKQELNIELKLYQRILYDLVKEALEGGFRELALGRTAMEIKSCLGARPRDYDLFLRLSNPLYNRLAQPIVANLPQESWQPRHPFKEI